MIKMIAAHLVRIDNIHLITTVFFVNKAMTNHAKPAARPLQPLQVSQQKHQQ